MTLLRKLAIYIAVIAPSSVAATWALDWWLRQPVPEPVRLPQALMAAERIRHNWATYPQLYEDAVLLSDFVFSEQDPGTVDESWLQSNFGDASLRIGEARQWNLDGHVFVKVYPDGSVTAWQSHRIIDEPSKGYVLSAVRIGLDVVARPD